MNATPPYWHKQTTPLFSQLDWDTPVRRDMAGQLVIMGGNAHNITDVSTAYELVRERHTGTQHLILPKSLSSLLGSMPDATFVESTSVGSFAASSQASVEAIVSRANGLLLPGQLGRNSETAKLLTAIILSIQLPTIATKDTVDYMYTDAEQYLSRPHLLLVLSLSQLQKLLRAAKWTTPVTFGMGAAQLVELLHEVTQTYPIGIATVHHGMLFGSSGGQVSTTKIDSFDEHLWQLRYGALAAVNTLHHKSTDRFTIITYSASQMNE